MKRMFSWILIFAIFASTLCMFSACGGFIGGISTFYNDSSEAFYISVDATLAMILGSFTQSFDIMPRFPTDGTATQMDLSVTLSDYEYNGKALGSDVNKFNASLLFTSDFDFELTTDLDAFGQKASLYCVSEKDNFYMDMGELTQKPFYYKGTFDESVFKKIKTDIVNELKSGTYVNGEEVYKLQGNTIKSETVEVCLNSDVTTEVINRICDLFIETENKILGSYLNRIMDVSYIISGEKLHLTWKRYFDDEKLCRESFKVHDNNGHHIILDTAYLQVEDTRYLEISVNAFDGNGVFNVFTLSAKDVMSSTQYTDGIHTTTADIMIGDVIHIETENKGDKTGTEGTASVHFMTEVGVADMKVNFSNNGGSSTLKLSADSIYMSFNAEISATSKKADKAPSIVDVGEDYYDISVLENRYFYDEAKVIFDKEYTDVATLLQGKTPEEDPKPAEPEVDPYELDINYDYSIIFETDGSYGQKYVDLLQSDTFTYSYTYHAREEGYPINKVTQYRKDGENLFLYNYADGTEYAQLFAGTTRYEVRHDLEKILFTEYSKEDFDRYYPEQVYIFYESGFCNYDNRELVFERYYDYSNNKYTFIFAENKEVELIVIESSSDQSMLYTFVEELSDTVPEDAMKLPSYEYQSVLDHFQ